MPGGEKQRMCRLAQEICIDVPSVPHGAGLEIVPPFVMPHIQKGRKTVSVHPVLTSYNHKCHKGQMQVSRSNLAQRRWNLSRDLRGKVGGGGVRPLKWARCVAREFGISRRFPGLGRPWSGF